MDPTTEHPSPSAAVTRQASARDPLVDGLRSIALGRVVLWHAFAAPWLSWVFPAMPVMFFLAGSVLAGSVAAGSGTNGQGAGPVEGLRRLARRVGRILIPFWVYSLGVLATMLIADRTLVDVDSGAADGDPWGLAVSLAVPLHQTSGTDRDWLTGHLWYLTDYLFLLLLLPIAVLLARRIVPVVAVALLGLIALEAGPLLGLPTLTGAARVGVGDLLCYGMFALLGIAWATRRSTFPTARAVAAGAALIAGSLVAGRFVPLPRGSLNESYLLLAVAALGWLLLIGAAERPLRRLAALPRVATATRAVSARALTVYLWHPAAILLALAVAPDGLLSGPSVLVLTVLFTVAAIVAFGWVEDIAARRPPRWWPGRRVPDRSRRPSTPISVRIGLTAAAASVMAMVAVGVSGVFADRTGTAVAAIPRPSDRTALADTAFAVATRDAAPPDDPADGPADLPAVGLQAALERWIATQREIDDAVVSIASGPQIWSGSGTRPDGEPAAAESTVGIASLTKTFTAAVAVQFAAEGLLDLDAPVPDLPGVAPLPDGETITARQLMQHSTGLVQYTDALGYDPARLYSAAELVSLSTQAPRLHPPDAGVTYSNSNYLWLGLLLESVSTSDYRTLLAERITGPLGLTSVDLITDDRTGWVGSASGGIVATPADVARFFDALLNRGEVLSTEGLARMTELNHLNGGLGVWPMCPCGEFADGGKWATGLGHYVGDGAAFAFPDDGLAVYVRLTGDQVSGERMVELRDQLMVEMRDTAKGGGVQP